MAGPPHRPDQVCGAARPVPQGRDREVAELQRWMVHDQPRGQIVELVGEAGIGKTHLIDHLAVLAAERDVAVFRGRASEFERDVPFAPLLDAFGDLRHGLRDETSPAHRYAVHEGIRRLLEQEARKQRLMVVLDDLHWADAASIDLIRALAARPPAGPVLLLVAHRPHQHGSAMRAAALGSIGTYAAARIELHGLSVHDAAALLPSSAAPAEVAATHRACGGNPFALLQLGRQLTQRGHQDPAAAAAAGPLAALLASELTALPAVARQLLQGAAVAGDPFDLGLASAVADLDEPTAFAALEALLAADIVRGTTQAWRFTFRHPLVRQSAYATSSAAWRLQAHQRAAETLRASGSGAVALANHVAQSGRHGDAEAIATLTEAGRLVAPRSPRSAAHWYGAAWALVPEIAQADPSHADLLYALGRALTVSGAGERALQLTSPTLSQLPITDPRRLRLELGRASICQTLGRLPAAREYLRTVQHGVGADASIEGLVATVALGSLEIHVGEVRSAREHIARAQAIAASVGFAPLTGMVEALGLWTTMVGGHDVTPELCDRAAAAFDSATAAARTSEPSMLAALAASEFFPVLLLVLVRVERHLGRFNAALRHVGDGLHVTRDGNWPVLAAVFLSGGALAQLELGNLREATELADAAEEEAAMIDSREADQWASASRCAVLEPTHDVDDAIHAGEQALAAAQQHAILPDVMHASALLARALLAAGLPTRAIDLLAPLQTPGSGDVVGLWRSEHGRLLAEAQLMRGELAAARRWAAVAAANPNTPLARRDAAAADAACLVAEGAPARAATIAAQAAASARADGALLEAGRLDLLAGRAHGAAGDRQAAAATLRNAEAQFAAMGADRLQTEAVRALRDVGRRVLASARGASPSREPLTPRQLEIAGLAAAGHANREIADQLFVSLKTVETHLSAVYVKLGITSRQQLRDGHLPSVQRVQASRRSR